MNNILSACGGITSLLTRGKSEDLAFLVDMTVPGPDGEDLTSYLYSLREAAKRTQLIVATHSDRLIRFLNPEEVVVMEMNDDGGASAIWADSMDLDQWPAEYTLDEVWRMGRMGG